MEDDPVDSLRARGSVNPRPSGIPDIREFSLTVSKAERAHAKNQRPVILWLTGLSGSGKSTLATWLDLRLHERGRHTYVLDGDNIRAGLNHDLGFSEGSRRENIRRVGEVAKLMLDAGLIVLVAFISPFRNERDAIRAKVEDREFVEIFVDCSLEGCRQRDTKGLYRKSDRGELKMLTGVDSPYERPLSPEIHARTENATVGKVGEQILGFLVKGHYI